MKDLIRIAISVFAIAFNRSHDSMKTFSIVLKMDQKKFEAANSQLIINTSDSGIIKCILCNTN